MRAPDRPIFVLGPPRSGTSVLYKLLCTHPDVAYLHRGFKKLPRLPSIGHALARAGIVDTTPKEGSVFWDRFRKRLRDDMGVEDATPDIRDFYRRAVAGIVEAAGKARFVAKFPPHSVRVAWLEAVFPDAVFVVALRDWRAVVSSTVIKREENARRQRREFFGIRVKGYKKMRKWPSEDSAARIYRVVQEELGEWSRKQPERFHDVVYSRLCADPRGVLRAVAEHCDLRWDDAFEHGLPESLPNSNHKWRDTLDAAVIRRIRDAEGPALDRYTEERLGAVRPGGR